MLVLTRKEGEEILLRLSNGQEIVVRICKLRSGRVRVGIVAAGDTSIVRKEIDNGKKD